MKDFHCRYNQIANKPDAPDICSICTVKTLQRGDRMTRTKRYHNTSRHKKVYQMVLQLGTIPQIQWKNEALPVCSKAKSSTHTSGARRIHT